MRNLVTDWRGGEFPFLCLLLVTSSAAFVFLVVEQLRELFFYRKNGWDFTQDSDIPLGIYYWGDNSCPEDIVSNRERILLARPIAILILAMLSMALASLIFHPEQWARENGSAELGHQPIVSTYPDGD